MNSAYYIEMWITLFWITSATIFAATAEFSPGIIIGIIGFILQVYRIWIYKI